ncbi:hypothetical protein GQ44DRAFT_489427 [Phaeosphaeriaceae sp. PMI808]|nr:hypothetical protein GQ44DRAFT_489427 [Phaeosphaeriaceae sp. PMI808]
MAIDIGTTQFHPTCQSKGASTPLLENPKIPLSKAELESVCSMEISVNVNVIFAGLYSAAVVDGTHQEKHLLATINKMKQIALANCGFVFTGSWVIRSRCGCRSQPNSNSERCTGLCYGFRMSWEQKRFSMSLAASRAGPGDNSAWTPVSCAVHTGHGKFKRIRQLTFQLWPWVRGCGALPSPDNAATRTLE